MIGISKLYCGAVEAADALRYNRQSGKLPSHLLQFSADKKPVVVWNMTKRCNLKCVHCYAKAVDPEGVDDINTDQAKVLIDDLSAYGAPVMLFSGGEPLVRQDLVELASYATSKGMRAVISTNGTLITKEKARELKSVGLSYVGISLDGGEEIHDKFRAVPGSFKKALQGVENCMAEGLKVGLRFTINKRNQGEVPKVFEIVRELDVPRICFYHLVYSGRGSELIKEDLDHAETRAVVNLIMDETRALFDASPNLLCAESVFLALAEGLGVDSPLVPRLATGFCSGLARTDGLCGAFSGGVLGLGLALGRDTAHDGLDRSYGAVQEFRGVFLERFGHEGCTHICGCRLDTDEGRKAFGPSGAKARCLDVVEWAAAQVVRILHNA